jgi:tetratricopeptide (TPR) repeat protein
MPRRHILTFASIATLLLLALALATCSNDGASEQAPEPTVASVETPTALATAPDEDTTAETGPSGIDLEAANEALDAIAEADLDSAAGAGEPGEESGADADLEEESDEPAIDVLFDYLRAVGLLNAGQYKEAVGRYNVVLRILPELYLAYHGRALAYYNEDLFDLALDDFNKAIEYKSDYAEALRNRGVLFGNQGRHDLARSDLELAVGIYREKGNLALMAEALTQLQRLP